MKAKGMRAGGKAKAKGYSVGGGAKRGKKKIVPTKGPRKRKPIGKQGEKFLSAIKRKKALTAAEKTIGQTGKTISKKDMKIATKKMQKGGKMMSKGGATGGRRRMNGKKNMGLYGRK